MPIAWDHPAAIELRRQIIQSILEELQKKRMKQIYIAGPMTGYPEFNFSAFFAAQKKFEDEGWKVWNPANKEAEKGVTEAKSFSSGDNVALVSEGWDWQAAFEWDCTKVIRSDAIYLLPGWEKSTGARAEWAVAQFAKAQKPEYQIIYG